MGVSCDYCNVLRNGIRMLCAHFGSWWYEVGPCETTYVDSRGTMRTHPYYNVPNTDCTTLHPIVMYQFLVPDWRLLPLFYSIHLFIHILFHPVYSFWGRGHSNALYYSWNLCKCCHWLLVVGKPAYVLGPIPEKIRQWMVGIRYCGPDRSIAFHKHRSRSVYKIDKLRIETKQLTGNWIIIWIIHWGI